MSNEYSEPRQSFLLWLISALGVKFTLLLPLAMLAAVVLATFLVWKGRGAAMYVGLALVVPLPLLVGVFGTLEGYLAALRVVASSSSTPQPEVLAEAWSFALVSTWVGLVLTLPGLLLAVVGWMLRAPNKY